MMRILPFSLLLFLLAGSLVSSGQAEYDHWFTDEQLRYDFLLAGNHSETRVYPVQISREPAWAGPQLISGEKEDMGTFRYLVTDPLSGKVLFSRGFCTLFQEWQSTAEARTTERAFYHAVFLPFPKAKVNLSFEIRNYDGEFIPLFTSELNPENYFIERAAPALHDSEEILRNGNPQNHVDLLFLSEGYTPEERDKFFGDARRLSEVILGTEPYTAEKDKFNVNAIFVPSQESGTDIPGESIYRNTVFNSTFYTFDVDRYLTTSDMRSIYDAAAGVAWDHIIILVNTTRYGGGGFYNFLTVCTTDHPLTPKVLVHELGHGLAGLGDEYYTSEVAYEDFYNPAIEPWEPNLTTLVNFDSKWKDMVDPATPVPTPRDAQYSGVVGAFEGGGYMTYGMFSPVQECLMKSNARHEFCPVCQRAIRRAISALTGE